MRRGASKLHITFTVEDNDNIRVTSSTTGDVSRDQLLAVIDKMESIADGLKKAAANLPIVEAQA